MYAVLHSRSVRLLAVWLTLLLPMVVGLSIAAAQESSTTITPAEGVPAVNVRSGPGTQYTIRFALNAGQSLAATGRTDATICTGNVDTDGWVRIIVSETIEGWVSLCAVTVSGDVVTLPVVEATFPELIANAESLEVLEGSSTFVNPHMIAATNAAVVMRAEPWLGSEALGIVPANAAVELVQMTTDMGWVQASYGETTGWLPGMTVIATQQQIQQITTIDISAVIGGGQLVQTQCVNGASLVVNVSSLIGGAFSGNIDPFPFYVFVCP